MPNSSHLKEEIQNPEPNRNRKKKQTKQTKLTWFMNCVLPIYSQFPSRESWTSEERRLIYLFIYFHPLLLSLSLLLLLLLLSLCCDYYCYVVVVYNLSGGGGGGGREKVMSGWTESCTQEKTMSLFVCFSFSNFGRFKCAVQEWLKVCLIGLLFFLFERVLLFAVGNWVRAKWCKVNSGCCFFSRWSIRRVN